MTCDLNIQAVKDYFVKFTLLYNSHEITLIDYCELFEFIFSICPDRNATLSLYLRRVNGKIDRFYYGDCFEVRHKYISVETSQVFKTA